MFSIPTESIKRNTKVSREKIRSVEGKQALVEDETIIPLVQLGELLGFPENLHINIAISFGFPKNSGDITRPPEPSGRRTWDDIVNWENW